MPPTLDAGTDSARSVAIRYRGSVELQADELDEQAFSLKPMRLSSSATAGVRPAGSGTGMSTAPTTTAPPLKVADVVTMTGYSADKIRRWAKNGTIPAFRYADGADWRFDADEVHRWMRGGHRPRRMTTGKRRY